MARVFLDTNIFVDIAQKRSDVGVGVFEEHELFLSPLSVHVLTYIAKQKIPSVDLSQLVDVFNIVPLDEKICLNSLDGPTEDYEDNVQLHSAARTNCNVFLTKDKKLLNMRFFGKARIASSFG